MAATEYDHQPALSEAPERAPAREVASYGGISNQAVAGALRAPAASAGSGGAFRPGAGTGLAGIARSPAPASPFRPGALGTGLALARAAGRPGAVARQATAPRGGSPLPASSSAASALLGSVSSDVRVHRGHEADNRLSSRPGALAVTEGTDIHVGSAAPDLDTPDGQLLIAHEAAHVMQQQAAGPEIAREVAEQEADTAAVGAMLGRSPGQLSAARGPHYFEAPKHSASLKSAMDQHGFTDAEQDAAYFGNWCRDLSQALVPTLTGSLGQNLTFQLVNLMAIRHFGHGVTPSQLGAYDPRQHIDNPAGQTDRDIASGSELDVAGYSGTDPITGEESGHAGTTSGEELKPENIAKSFEVSAAGVPAYIERSKKYILEEFAKAKQEGRNAKGLFHLGNFSHTSEDLFAHSNWVEMAVGKLIKDGAIELTPQAKKETDDRMKAHLPPIEDYAAEVRDKAGQARPILATGTFSGGNAAGNRAQGNDTMVSISEEAKNMIISLNPFKEEEEGKPGEIDFALKVLGEMDKAGDEGRLGDIAAGMADPLLKKIDDFAQSAVAPVDSLKGQGSKLVGDNWAGHLLDKGADVAAGGAHAVANKVGGFAKDGAKAAIKTVFDQFGKTGISLAEIALWVKKGIGKIGELWGDVKKAVKELPQKLVELIMPELIAAEKAFKKKVRELGTAAYTKATEKIVQKIQAAAAPTHVKDTNVDKKLRSWAEGLSDFMAKKYAEVGGEDGAKLGGEVPKVSKDEDIPAVIAYAETAFPDTLKRLTAAAVGDAKRQAEADLKSADDSVHQLKQLSNVPEWARAGASHSQIAKDHADSPFFGLAFQLANKADQILVGILKDAWGEQGDTGPAPELNENYGEKNADGTQKVDEEGNPVLANDGEGLEEWDKKVRKDFLKNRMQGQAAVKDGQWPHKDIGPALSAVADSFVEIIRKAPVLGPTFDGLIKQLKESPDSAESMKALAAARKQWDTYAMEGRFDDDVMAGRIDQLFIHAESIIATAKHDNGHSHGEGHEGHDHSHGCPTVTNDGASCNHKDGQCGHDSCNHAEGECSAADANHGGQGHELCNHDKNICHGTCDHPGGKCEASVDPEGGEIHTKEQIQLLNQFRSKGGVHKDPKTGKESSAPQVDKLNKAIQYDKKKGSYGKTEMDKAAEESAKGPAEEHFSKELDRIFGHPYDTTWWVPTVQAWCGAHKPDLERYIHDRNSGKAHVH